MDRRGFLMRGAALGCSLAASPLVTPMSFAGAPGEARLVVILLRGAMDGLGVVSPYGDPDFAALGRPPLTIGPQGALDLDGRFALHGALRPLEGMWRSGDLGFVHAVSTPYRDKRSHFDGQDMLEAGVAQVGSVAPQDGWLNRLLMHLPGTTAETAYAVGSDPFLILKGEAEVSRWTPEADLYLSPQALALTRMVMQSDPEMAAALARAFDLADSDGDAMAFTGDARQTMTAMQQDMMTPGQRRDMGAELARFTAGRLRGAARIACYSLTGWDTHNRQEADLPRALRQLSDTLLTLQEELGPEVWGRTTVVGVTEFGRTARWNGGNPARGGPGGTDHGTGGAMLLAGGAVRGGRVSGDWPGLAEADLYQRRDLRPTRDLRAHLAWILRGLYGLDRRALESDVFPALDMGEDPGLLL